MTVRSLSAKDVFVTGCSEGLFALHEYLKPMGPVVASESELVSMLYMEIAAGGWIEIVSILEKGQIKLRIESLDIGANYSSEGLNTFPLRFVEPGTECGLAGVSWKSV